MASAWRSSSPVRAASSPPSYCIQKTLQEIAHGADRRAAFAWLAMSWLLDEVVTEGSRAILVSALDAVRQEMTARLATPSQMAAPPRLGRLGSVERSDVAAKVFSGIIEPRFAAF